MSILDANKKNKKDLSKKLDKVLGKEDCVGDECLIQDPQEIVRREHKKIITTDGRELLSEYTV